MAPEQKKKLVLARIEDLWAAAETVSGDAETGIVPAAESETGEDQSAGSIMSRINRLMYEAEETQLAANDLQQAHPPVAEAQMPEAPLSIDELAEGISLDVDSPAATDDADLPEDDSAAAAADDAAAPEDDIAALGSMVMAAAASGAADEDNSFEDNSFEEAKSRLEDVSRLHPPQSDNSIPDDPEYAFGLAFSNLVRHVVREYIETEFEPVLRNAIRSEIENHLGGNADETKLDADGGNDG